MIRLSSLADRLDASANLGSYTLVGNTATYEQVPKVKKIVDPMRSRFSDAPWMTYLNSKDVIVVGAGGIGSWVTMCLARIGCSVTLFDADTFEVHNMGGQLVMDGYVGMNKTRAVAEICGQLTGYSSVVSGMSEMYNEGSFTNPIMISAVDSMKARKLIFEKWTILYGEDEEAIFIDGRLLAEDYQVYAVTKGRLEAYRATLFNDEDVPTENCTLKSTTHCGLGIASDMIGVLTNHAANMTTRPQGFEVRDVPFKIVKSIPNFLYNITFEPDESAEEVNNARTVPVHSGQLEVLQ